MDRHRGGSKPGKIFSRGAKRAVSSPKRGVEPLAAMLGIAHIAVPLISLIIAHDPGDIDFCFRDIGHLIPHFARSGIVGSQA